jgi:hypothetical protein
MEPVGRGKVTSTSQERQKKTMNDHVTPENILQLGLGFWGSTALLSAVGIK